MENEKLNQIIDTRIRQQLNNGLFTARKITDIPLDDFQVVNRGYVNLGGTTAGRPGSPSKYQQYFDTDVGKPIFYNGSAWVDATGTAI